MVGVLVFVNGRQIGVGGGLTAKLISASLSLCGPSDPALRTGERLRVRPATARVVVGGILLDEKQEKCNMDWMPVTPLVCGDIVEFRVVESPIFTAAIIPDSKKVLIRQKRPVVDPLWKCTECLCIDVSLNSTAPVSAGGKGISSVDATLKVRIVDLDNNPDYRISMLLSGYNSTEDRCPFWMRETALSVGDRVQMTVKLGKNSKPIGNLEDQL